MIIKPWYAVPMDVLEALGGLKQDDPPILWTDGEVCEALHPVGSWGGRRGYFLLPPSTPALRNAVARAYDIRPENLLSWRLAGNLLQIQHVDGLLQVTLTWGLSDEHEALGALACRLAGTNHALVTLPNGSPRSGRTVPPYLPPVEAVHMDHLTLRERCYNRLPAYRGLGAGQLAMPELLKLVAVDMFVAGVGTDQDLADEVRRQLSHLQTHGTLP